MPATQNLNNAPEPAGEEVRTAIILAAGMGLRLKEKGKKNPKGLICLGDKSIIEESVIRLQSVGITRIVIVTGHLFEHYQHLQRRFQDTVQLVHNPHFADSGSMYSLFCARHHVNGTFLLLESDLVYERRALTTCLTHASDNVVLLAGFSGTSDECFVETKGGDLASISKTRQSLGTEVNGELVGICKISQSLFSEMIRTAEQRFCHTRHVAYETDSLVAASQVMPISCPVVEDLVWCEIDDETHLTRARNRIYPRVQELDLHRDSTP